MPADPKQRPRVGIPYRTRKEELTGDFDKIEKYVTAVRMAGGEPVVVSLGRSPHSGNSLRTSRRANTALINLARVEFRRLYCVSIRYNHYGRRRAPRRPAEPGPH